VTDKAYLLAEMWWIEFAGFHGLMPDHHGLPNNCLIVVQIWIRTCTEIQCRGQAEYIANCEQISTMISTNPVKMQIISLFETCRYSRFSCNPQFIISSCLNACLHGHQSNPWLLYIGLFIQAYNPKVTNMRVSRQETPILN
jgi:hypothetical protein